jgi:hypothetical protein
MLKSFGSGVLRSKKGTAELCSRGEVAYMLSERRSYQSSKKGMLEVNEKRLSW